MEVTPYNELDALSKKARDAEQRLDCGKCPRHIDSHPCSPLMQKACDYIFIQGFRRGYNKRKREEKGLKK